MPTREEIWEAAERRADWEERHGRFVEFSNVKDLLSYLHLIKGGKPEHRTRRN